MTRIKLSLGPRFKLFWCPITIAIWTILQSLAHVWWVVYGRGLLACNVQVKRKLEFYLYMTYLYSGNECDNQALDTYAKLNFTHNKDANSSRLMHIPRLYKHDGTMTDSLMDFYLGSDAVWIVSSVGLLIGILMRLKQGSALAFYLPWILVTMIILAMDLFSSVYYALQLPSAQVIQTTFTWKLENSTIMAIISGRLGFILIINAFNMAYIIWYTRVTYKQRYSDERRRRKPKMRREETETRIKNWQLFYGVLDDTNTTGTTGTCGTSLPTQQRSGFMDDEDLNYTTTFKELEDYNHKRHKCEGSNQEPELCSTFKTSSSSVHNEQTMANKAQVTQVAPEAKKKVHITELVSHLPWSYIDNKLQTKTKATNDEVTEKDVRAKRVVVMEPGKNIICNPDLKNEQVSRF